MSRKEILKKLREERASIKAVVESLKAKKIPFNNSPGLERYEAAALLLQISIGPPVHVDLAKAALELTAYNDRIAMILMEKVAEDDYKKLIRRAKGAE